MALIEKQTPYEFLVRWDDSGRLQGAHLVDRIAHVDDATGAEVNSKLTHPRPVSLADEALLRSIGAQVNAAALEGAATSGHVLSKLRADLAQARAERDQLAARLRQPAAKPGFFKRMFGG
jgi:aspartate oxidase